jgi:hypothetical protein
MTIETDNKPKADVEKKDARSEQVDDRITQPNEAQDEWAALNANRGREIIDIEGLDLSAAAEDFEQSLKALASEQEAGTEIKYTPESGPNGGMTRVRGGEFEETWTSVKITNTEPEDIELKRPGYDLSETPGLRTRADGSTEESKYIGRHENLNEPDTGVKVDQEVEVALVIRPDGSAVKSAEEFYRVGEFDQN